MKGGTHVGKIRTVYDVAHARPWGWRVGAYLWTKAIAAGALVVAALLLTLGLAAGPLLAVGVPVGGAGVPAATGVLLIADLKRPDRFYFLFTKPNWTSWLVWGARIILIYGALATLWLLLGMARLPLALGLIAWAAALAGLGTAGYSAFLFGQAEGRDFWQSPLLLPHLLLAALVGGAGSLALLGLWLGAGPTLLGALATVLIAAAALGFLVALMELYGPHPNQDVAAAAHLLRGGVYAAQFWAGAGLLGTGLPVLLAAAYLGTGLGALLALGALSALVGIWLYEDAWVRTGQAIAMS